MSHHYLEDEKDYDNLLDFGKPVIKPKPINQWFRYGELTIPLSDTSLTSPHHDKKTPKKVKRFVPKGIWQRDFVEISSVLARFGYTLCDDVTINNTQREFKYVHEYDTSYFIITHNYCTIGLIANTGIKSVGNHFWSEYVQQQIEKSNGGGPIWVKRNTKVKRPCWRHIVITRFIPKIKRNMNERLIKGVIES